MLEYFLHCLSGTLELEYFFHQCKCSSSWWRRAALKLLNLALTYRKNIFRTLNNIIFTPIPTKTDLKKCTTHNFLLWSDDAFFAYSAAAVQYRLGRVKRVPLSKVTLVPNSDHLACHLTCTFMFAPCPANLYCSDTVVPLLISREDFRMELWLAFRSYGARYDWRETFEKHMAKQGWCHSKVFGFVYLWRATWADTFCILSWSLESDR